MHGLPRFSALLDPMQLFSGPGSVPCRWRAPCPICPYALHRPRDGGAALWWGSASLGPTGSNTDLFQRLPHIPSGNPMPPALRTTSVKPRWCKTRHHSPPWRGSGGRGGPCFRAAKANTPFLSCPLSYQLCFCCQAPRALRQEQNS